MTRARTGAAVVRAHTTAGFGDGTMVLRTAVAAGLAWWIATALLHSDTPSVAPAGAVLAAQTTPFATARKSLQRAAGILFGFGLGVAATASGGVNAVSVLLVVLIGMYAGRMLKLGSQMHQIALTGVLVMGTASSFGYGAARLEGNVVGILLGTLLGLIVPAPGFGRRAGEELARLNRQLAELLSDISQQLGTADWSGQARGWVDRARALSQRLDTVRDAVREAEDAVRLRPRGAAARAHINRLAEATHCLDHVGHQIRGVTRGLYNLTFKDGRPPARHAERHADHLLPEPAPAPAGLGTLLAELSAILAELAEIHTWHQAPPPELRERLRAMLASAEHGFTHTALGASPAYADWRVLCVAGIAEDVRRMLHELDPESGPHQAAFGA
ncbi:FUSC family protein [Streptomyces apocyni]|uniref:FUSC family protein n=1 Tax=Streptomyces apocyni TaxID=2654677 RepID=UPI0018D094E9|nr:aromatic acid exporter family protein [Streptomyces apocyni]